MQRASFADSFSKEHASLLNSQKRLEMEVDKLWGELSDARKAKQSETVALNSVREECNQLHVAKEKL